jgi:hypothetical protein
VYSAFFLLAARLVFLVTQPGEAGVEVSRLELYDRPVPYLRAAGREDSPQSSPLLLSGAAAAKSDAGRAPGRFGVYLLCESG